MTERDDDRARIRAVIQTISDAWLKGTPEDLPAAVSGCFHDNVVFRGADFQVVAHGVPAAIASFQDFMRSATISRCRIGKPEIDLAGDSAIVTFQWEMAYRFGDSDNEESGYEIDVLTRGDDHRWRVRWRTLVLTPRAVS